MNKKIFVISWAIYSFDVLVCLGVTRDAIIQYFKKFKQELSEDELGRLVMFGDGRCIMFEDGQTILWIKDMPKKGSSVLAHEIFHAVIFLMDRIGIKLLDGSDEAYA